MIRYVFVLLVCLSLLATNAMADTVRVAVASNFLPTAKLLAQAFETDHAYTVELRAGSSGKLFTQIVQGAKIDIFLSADQMRPHRLRQQFNLSQGDLLDYARGTLLWWSKRPHKKITEAQLDLATVAIANPKLAPYGRAASQVLEQLEMSSQVDTKIVTAENITQVVRFVKSGAVDFALVAASQRQALDGFGYFTEIDTGDYLPIVQTAARLSSTQPAIEFWQFLQSDRVRDLVSTQGYRQP